MECQIEQDTILHFIYIQDENENLNKFFNSVRLEVADMQYEFKESNDIKINIELDENCIYYNEVLNLYTKENDEISLDYPIYKNKINNIYIDIEIPNSQKNSEKKLISLEIIYQTINNELLPKNIYYGDKKLVLFDTFQNKLRKRIGLVNIDPEKLNFIEEIHQQYPEFEFQNQNSYQILARIPNEGNIQYSIANCELNINNNRLKSQKNNNFNFILNKNDSLSALLSFKNDFYSSWLKNLKYIERNDAKIKIDEFIEKYKVLQKEKSYYDNIMNYDNLEIIDIDIFLLMFYYLMLLEIKEIKDNDDKNAELIGKLYGFDKFNDNYEKNISELKNLNINIKDKLLLIKSYNKIFANSLKSGEKINYINIINIEKEEPTNPYLKAIQFIKDIIINLKEESRLFEIFLYLDSDSIENLLINREKTSVKFIDNFGNKKQIDYGKNPTEYGVNMANIDEVRSHLFKLIPKYIIRIDTKIKFNAYYDPNSKIMHLNENRLFNLDSQILSQIFKQDDELKEIYILPIIIEILHELFAHGKKRLTDKDSHSPEEYRDSKHNFKRCKVQKKVEEFKIIDYPESGMVLENYISENRNIIRWLKKIHGKNEGKKIMDISLWIETDFKKLENLVQNFINLDNNYNNGKNNLYKTFVSSADEDFIDSEDDSCGFHKF